MERAWHGLAPGRQEKERGREEEKREREPAPLPVVLAATLPSPLPPSATATPSPGPRSTWMLMACVDGEARRVVKWMGVGACGLVCVRVGRREAAERDNQPHTHLKVLVDVRAVQRLHVRLVHRAVSEEVGDEVGEKRGPGQTRRGDGVCKGERDRRKKRRATRPLSLHHPLTPLPCPATVPHD